MGYDPETDQVTRVYRFSTAADAEDGDTITQAQLDAAIDEVVAAINAALPAKLSVDSVATISITWRGAWAPETAYAVGDIVRESGSSYICVTAHTSAVDGAFSLDLSAGKWDVLAEKGAAGEGTGDMLGENNLSDVADKTTALATLGGQPKNVALTNLANVAVGLIAKTNSDGTMTPRSIVVTANTGISVTNGDGVAGNPTLAGITRTQAQWDAGTDTTEATISPAKLDAKMIAARDAQTLGWGQTWQNVTASRTSGTAYQNTTGRPIMVSITGDGSSTHGAFQVSVNGTTWVNAMSNFGDVDGQCVVPNGHYYRQNGGVSPLVLWAELR